MLSVQSTEPDNEGLMRLLVNLVDLKVLELVNLV